MHLRSFTEEMVDEVFSKDDLDKDGLLNYHEARRFCYTYALFVDHEFPFYEFFTDYYEKMNQVGDGKIALVELKAFFRNYGAHTNVSDEMVKNVFCQFDKNNDGHFTFDEASYEFADFIRSIRKDLHGR